LNWFVLSAVFACKSTISSCAERRSTDTGKWQRTRDLEVAGRSGRRTQTSTFVVSEGGSGVSLAELIAALSLSIDLGLGQPMEHVLRASVSSGDAAQAPNGFSSCPHLVPLGGRSPLTK
jgi:hypothetical protein